MLAREGEAHIQAIKLSSVDEFEPVEHTTNYLKGWKLHVLTIAYVFADGPSQSLI